MQIKSDDTTGEQYRYVAGHDMFDIFEYGLLTHEQYVGFLIGNVYKYIRRYKHKNGKEDLAKAAIYLDKLTKVEYTEESKVEK